MDSFQFNIDPKVFKYLDNLTKQIQDSIKPFSEVMESHKDTLKKFSEKLAEMPDVIKSLSKYGWFVNFDMLPREIFLLGNYLKNNYLVSLDHYMIDYVNDNLDYIEREVAANYKKRKAPLVDAFEAHRNGLFNLSVPVFLSQTEGIFKSYSGVQIYAGGKDGPATTQWVSTMYSNTILDSFLNPLNFKESIRNHRKNEFIDFTRNDVLHGENYEYGTEINSAKSISFLYYIISLIETIETK